MIATKDIHTHILFGVDDGARTIEESLALLEHEIKLGYREVYLTPHMISGSSQTASKEIIYQNFALLKEKAKHLPITLHLGSEIYYVDKLIERINRGEFIPLGDSNQYLVEFSTKVKRLDFDEVIYNASLENITIFIAHPERYINVKMEEIMLLKKLGAMIQVNQDSLQGKEGFVVKRRAKKLVKLGIVDAIASDIHHL